MKKRVLYLDVLKVIASIAVVLIHWISEYWYDLDINSSNFVILTFMDSLIRFCVPAYLMISGALFLRDDKDVTIKDIFKRYIPRILIIFIFWNIVYNLLNVFIIKKSVFNFSVLFDIVLKTFMGKGIFQLYFLPTIIGFYLCVPILKLVTKRENRDILKYFIFFLLAVNVLNTIFNITINRSLYYPILFDGYILYFIIGYYLYTFEISKKNTKLIYLSGFISFLIIFLGTIFYSKYTLNHEEIFFKYASFNVIIYSSSIFLLIKNIISDKNSIKISNISKVYFGIYLIHGLVIGVIEFTHILKNIPVVIGVILGTIITYLISYICILIGLKIPVVKSLISLERNK